MFSYLCVLQCSGSIEINTRFPFQRFYTYTYLCVVMFWKYGNLCAFFVSKIYNFVYFHVL